jgi:hypothetical protein
MLLIIRHFHPALATVVGAVVGVCFVAFGVATDHSLFVLSGAVSVLLSIARTNHNVRGARRQARS